MPIRFVNLQEYERAQQIVTYCFPWLHEVSDESMSYKIQHIKPEYVLGFYDESDHLMALAENIPFKIMISGFPMDMGGIAMVASLPEGRHAGHVASILKRWIEIMRERGQTLSMLGPFSYEFYRKYGWELGFERMNYTIPIDRLKTFSHKTGHIRPFVKEDLNRLNDLYTMYAQNHNGCALRDETLWIDFVLNDPFSDKYKRYTYLWLYEDDTLGGYVIYTIKDNKMNIHEMIYKDIQAEEELLSFIYSHQSQIDQVIWSTSTDERLHLILPNPRIEMKLTTSMMFRVVDVENALIKRKYPDDLDVIFDMEISDQTVPWNQGPWHVHIFNGHADVKKIDMASARCDIQTFSQIFLGYMTAKDAARLGKLKGNEAQIEHMNKVFLPSVTFNNNGF